MERDLWRVMVSALKRVPRRRPRNVVYDDREVVAVLLWAALHDRAVSWACRRANWPTQAWRRRLPHQSTMSRRMRDPVVVSMLRELLRRVDRAKSVSVLIVDAKPLEVSRQSRDPDAGLGWSIEGYGRGYKLHAMIDGERRVLSWRLHALNVAEPVVARALVRETARYLKDRLPAHAPLLGDSAYDSNPLHLCASVHGIQVIAPRKRPFTGLGERRHHRSRLACIRAVEAGRPLNHLVQLRKKRESIERFFGAMATVGGGLNTLPPWARRRRRVELWVGAKLVINAARIRLLR